MDDAEGKFWLADRLQKIRQIITENGEENFYLAFSGGKDSTALSCMIDEAVPGNQIPRVYANTGIEYQMMVQFVKSLQEQDKRIVIISPGISIPKMLEKDGYPFKSKEHSSKLAIFQRSGMTEYVGKYVNGLTGRFSCPAKLQYQFSQEFRLKISDKCCLRLKEYPAAQWQKSAEKTWTITGIVRAEGGRRVGAKCVVFATQRGRTNRFNPLAPVSPAFVEWYTKYRNVPVCDLYKKPYYLKRTGCAGCPFNPYLQKYLDMFAAHLPLERKKCERIWAPVYAEYRRIGYRLRSQLSIDDYRFIE